MSLIGFYLYYKVYIYEIYCNLLTGSGYYVATSDQSFTYNHLGQLTQVEDARSDRLHNRPNQPIHRHRAQRRNRTFEPIYDADGNQTHIKTATGIWNVTYNAENRPVRFESADGATVIDCTYDYMGRRLTRKVTVNGAVSNYLRYIYRGYLQIAAIDAVSGVFRWFLFWDPTQPEATRPLTIRKDGTWYAYGWDLTKNVTKVFGKTGLHPDNVHLL